MSPSPGRTSMGQLKVLLWKNTFMMRKRHWILTLLEVLAPLLLFVFVVFVRSEMPKFVAELTTSFNEPINQESLIKGLEDYDSIIFAPTNNFTKELMSKTNLENTVGVAAESDLLHVISSKAERPNVAAVIFEGEAASMNHGVPKTLRYKLRFMHSDWTYGDFFQSSGFGGLQLLINKAFTGIAADKENREPPADEIFLQEMPTIGHMDDEFRRDYFVMMTHMLNIFLMFSFMIMCTTVTKRVVEEKQLGAKELMKLMGLRNWAYWMSWIVDAMIVRAITAVLIVSLLTMSLSEKGAVLEKSSPTLLFFMLSFYGLAATVFLCAISTFFSKPTLAMFVSLCLWLGSHVPAYFLVDASEWHKLLLSVLFPNMGLVFMMQTVLDYEHGEIGALWSNFHGSGLGMHHQLSLLNVWLMFIIGTVFYAALIWYMSEVNPGDFGYKQPYFFFLSRAYWSGEDVSKAGGNTNGEANSANFEHPLTSDLRDKNVGIMIRNLTKTYPGKSGQSPVSAVQGLSLDINQGEITALLGHNGAGKTTTMSILTGMIASTSGDVRVLGHDLKLELNIIRHSLGLCPQHDLLFSELTVYEHLFFFAMLKGKSVDSAKLEAMELLACVRLLPKKNSWVSELSGGMKRKLSLAIALIGDSKVVMLDEPTTGLDPEARREIWDLLLQLRKHRTIVLSTHFMEEADVLGDTIAIMAHGKVVCCGSTMYLKRLYGAGYHLNLMRENKCDTKELTKAVQKLLPEATLELSQNEFNSPNSPGAGPISFTLPANKSDHFPGLFDAIESAKDELGVSSIGVSVTTMEEVFLKVGELSASAESSNQATDHRNVTKIDPDTHNKTSIEINTGWILWAEQLQALLKKKLIFCKRHWGFTLMQIVLPILTFSLAVSFSYMVFKTSNDPIEISLEQVFGTETTALYSYNKSGSSLAKLYRSSLKNMAHTKEVSGDLLSAFVKIAGENLRKYHSNYIVSAMFTETEEGNLKIVGFMGRQPKAAAVSLDLVSNAYLKYKASDEYHIVTVYHPILREETRPTIDTADQLLIYFIWIFIPHLGLILTTAASVMLPLQERISFSRHLQTMTGCSRVFIWLSYFLLDMLIVVATSMLATGFVCLIDSEHLFSRGGNEIGVLMLVIIVYGLTGTTFAYFISFVRSTQPSAFATLALMNFMIGVIVNIVIFIVELGDAWSYTGYTGMRQLFGLLLPQSALISSLFRFSAITMNNSVCSKGFSCAKGAISAGELLPLICCENLCKQENTCFKHLPFLFKTSNYTASFQALKLLSGGGGRGGMLFSWLDAYGTFGEELIVLLIGSVVWMSLALLLDSGLISKVKESILRYMEREVHNFDNKLVSGAQDVDVVNEMQRADDCFRQTFASDLHVVRLNDAATTGEKRPILAVAGLQKHFGIPIFKKRFMAVRGISFIVEEGECFGLLGVNGAGKSTTFHMLSGSMPPTFGNAILNGNLLKGNQRQFLSSLGYCPQTDAQIGILTGRETLELFAKLRGVVSDKIDYVVNNWLTSLGLEEYADRQCMTYSGGNRRKVSAAVALIGGPSVSLMDEPTSGVDPIARRQLWKILALFKKSGHSIVLTSHSMDECEALCNRLGIMVGGEMLCLGPIGHIKNKYGQGYTLMVKVRSDTSAIELVDQEEAEKRLSKLKADIQHKFEPCELMDEHQGLLQYQVKEAGQKWSFLFKTMGVLLQKHSIIEDYTLSETTLEQVFLSFARLRDATAKENLSSRQVNFA